jgi:predicted lipid-binding transport protein (Tim44 family)
MTLSFRTAIAIVAASLIAVAPAASFAKAGSTSGGGMSAGSRGSQTNSVPPSSGPQRAQPIERTTTQTPATAPARSPGAAAATPAAGGVGGWAQRNPFMAGIAGGFIGAGIGSLLFGGAGGLSSGGAAGMIGMLLQVLLFGGLAYIAFRLLRRVFAGNAAQPAMTTPEGATFRTAGGPQQDDRSGYQPGQGSGMGGLFASAPALQPITVAETDLDVFSGILLEVQAAWTAGDVAKLRALATPEMVSYFSEALSDNASKGVSNHVENITLLKGDVEQSWTEEGRDYVTASLTWSALDYNVKLDQLTVVIGGDRSKLVESTEMWTFMRSKGGRWLLSAIQQVG